MRPDHAGMRILLRTLLILLLAIGGASLALAQDAPDGGSAQAAPVGVDQLNAQLEQIRQALADSDKLGDAALQDLRARAQTLQQQADQLVGSLSPQSDALKAKLDVLGPAPEKGQPAEPPEVANQRKQLTKDKADLDAQIKQAKTVSLESQQLSAQVASLRRQLFEARISQRTSSPLTRAFWASLSRNGPDDRAGLAALGQDAWNAVAKAWQPGNRLPLFVCLLAAIALFAVGRRLLERVLVQLTSDRMPAGHLRRSALAVLIALGTMLTYGFAAYLLYLALDWNGTLGEEIGGIAASLVVLAWLCSYIAGLGRALLSAGRPSWRMPALSDDLARRLRPFPTLLAWCTLLLGLVERITVQIAASLSTTVAVNGLLALLVAGLIGAALVRMGRARRALLAAGATPGKRPLWVGLLVAAAFAGVILAILGVLTGYIAFAFFVARQMLRGGVIVASLYLLMHLVNDLYETLLSPASRTGTRLQESFGVAPARLEQTAVILSGVSRAFLLLLAIPLLLAPYGAGPVELINRGGQLFAVRSIGTLPIVPGNIFNALVVLAVGVGATRVLKRWLSQQLLPKTSLEPGMQMSIVTLLSYVCGVLVFVLVLGALKVNLQSITWVASALSVGIGFGLQAIVQNFISGLILLAERPVKVGDWVSLPGAGVEGDIKRINVRATEIQQGDRSTVIVPNSQLITQNVRNVTQAGALGRVQIRLPLPLGIDAGKARKVLLGAMNDHPSTLETPKPSVQLDTIEGQALIFVCTSYVSGPRDVAGVKSDLLFEMLDRLATAQVPMALPQNMILHRPPAEPKPAAPKPGDDSTPAPPAA
jgi:small-conductance mechanosensitive channel